MSETNQMPLEAILDKLNELVASAFDGPIGNEKPRLVTPPTSIVIEPFMLRISKDGEEATGSKTHEEHQFKIVIKQPMPQAVGNTELTIPKIKIANANALRGTIQARGAWNGIANYAMIRQIAWPDDSPMAESIIETHALFSCQTGTPFY